MANSSSSHAKPRDRFELSLVNQQTAHEVDRGRILNAARRVLADSRFTSAVVSLAVVDDPTIHELNRKFLAHDYPTDVLSFVLEERDGHLEGEVVLSAETAATVAREAGWDQTSEQLLYAIHGMLHLVGLRDTTESEAQKMRAAEYYYLRECGADFPQRARVVADAADTNRRAGGPEGKSPS